MKRPASCLSFHSYYKGHTHPGVFSFTFIFRGGCYAFSFSAFLISSISLCWSPVLRISSSMPRHTKMNHYSILQQYHPYHSQKPMRALATPEMCEDTESYSPVPPCTSSTSPDMFATRPTHYAPIRSYSPQPEIYDACCTYASTSRWTLDMHQLDSQADCGTWQPQHEHLTPCSSNNPSPLNDYSRHHTNQNCAAPPSSYSGNAPTQCVHQHQHPHLQSQFQPGQLYHYHPNPITSTSSPVITHSFDPQSHAAADYVSLSSCPYSQQQALSPVDLASPVSASPCDPVACDYPMDCSDSATIEESCESAEQVLYQPRPRRRIPIVSLADLADVWQIDEHGQSKAPIDRFCREDHNSVTITVPIYS